jgi:hypothetical protein
MIRQKWKISKTIQDGVGSMTSTGLDFLERNVEEKFGTENTLFLPWMSIKLHLKVWNNFYLYTNASPEEVEEVKKIYTQEEMKKGKENEIKEIWCR